MTPHTCSMSVVLAMIGLMSLPLSANSQVIDTVSLSEQAFVHHPFVYSTFSSLIDRNGAPYIYTANVEYGLRVFDITDVTAPVDVLDFWPPSFGGLKPTNLFQEDDLLYVCLGGFQGATQNSGLAILDVSDPSNAVILDQWDSAAFTIGSAIVRVQNGMAFLGAMEEGIIALDVSDPSDIGYVGHYQPDPLWPGIVAYPPNARGMALRDDTLYLAYDAGCLRAIDISDPAAMTEIGHYVNPLQPVNTAVAYNNIALVGDHAFITTDFCGFEVVDISNVASMQQVAWINPWNCNGLSWFGSDGHTNDLVTAMGDSLIFISGGDSEVLIYDITSPGQPALVGGLISPNDSAVAWGVDVFNDLAVLSYIDNSLVLFPPQPYYGNDGGVQLLQWTADLITGLTEVHDEPFTAVVRGNDIVLSIRSGVEQLHLFNSAGQLVGDSGNMLASGGSFTLQVPSPGIYIVQAITADGSFAARVPVMVAH
ncbi:MAG: hypothetical protein IPI55_00805 [Flavobacteriales bacterium]|nr:hypothetical protein [Flavobacteriales bacterium]